MDIRIGVIQSPKELDLELADDANRDEIKSRIAAAIADSSVLWLTDRKGQEVGVAGERIAYVEIGSDSETHRIGFGG